MARGDVSYMAIIDVIMMHRINNQVFFPEKTAFSKKQQVTVGFTLLLLISMSPAS
jgi:hypothetical protein